MDTVDDGSCCDTASSSSPSGSSIFVVAGRGLVEALADLLTNRFTLPGTDSQRAERILQDRFGQRSTGSFTLVIESDGGATASLLPRGAHGGGAGRSGASDREARLRHSRSATP